MLQSAISDIKSVVHSKTIKPASQLSHRMMSRLVHDNTDAFYRMSLLYYHMGEAEDSLRYSSAHGEQESELVAQLQGDSRVSAT